MTRDQHHYLLAGVWLFVGGLAASSRNWFALSPDLLLAYLYATRPYQDRMTRGLAREAR